MANLATALDRAEINSVFEGCLYCERRQCPEFCAESVQLELEEKLGKILQRHGVGDFAKHSRQGYQVLYRTTRAAVLFRPNCPLDPYVVAFGYDEQTGTWAQGNYLCDLTEAKKRAGV